jgi:hypothetical protein
MGKSLGIVSNAVVLDGKFLRFGGAHKQYLIVKIRLIFELANYFMRWANYRYG